MFPTQGSNMGLPHCRQNLYHLSQQEARITAQIIILSLLSVCGWLVTAHLWFSSHTGSKVWSCVASLYPSDKLTRHFTKMDNWKRELAPKEYIRGGKKLIMLKLNLNQVLVEFYRRKSWSWIVNTAAVPETSNMQPEEPSESCWMTWTSSVVADKGWQCPRGSKHLVIEGTHRYFTTLKAPKLKCGKLIET